MNIAFLIGNGFDLQIGMKTSYSDFYNYYVSNKSEEKYDARGKKLISDFKKDISANYENWADLELGLGEYTLKLENESDFEVIYDDIVVNLSFYLKVETDKYDFDGLGDLLLEDIDLFYQKFKFDNEIVFLKEDRNFNFINFNYTFSIKRILNKRKFPFLINFSPLDNSSIVSLNHIHGTVKDRMILGVSDKFQIKNKDLVEDTNMHNSFIKPIINEISDENVDLECYNILNKSDYICIFGLSLGDSDRIYWEKIGEKLKIGDCKCCVFFKGDKEIKKIFPKYKFRNDNEIKDLFLSKTDLTDGEKEEVRERIFISYNSDIFNFKVKEKVIVKEDKNVEKEVDRIVTNININNNKPPVSV
ncbi:MAG: bacteriophage abortive infection AbiH family protein [Bacteroidetes bacterium]|nr:bacteriophage abortive infection AbiH family protein [Bacteroidota bacterium]